MLVGSECLILFSYDTWKYFVVFLFWLWIFSSRRWLCVYFKPKLYYHISFNQVYCRSWMVWSRFFGTEKFEPCPSFLAPMRASCISSSRGDSAQTLAQLCRNPYQAERFILVVRAKPEGKKNTWSLVCVPWFPVCFPTLTKVLTAQNGCSRLTLKMVNICPQSYRNPCHFFVCMASLLRFPLWSRGSWEDLHFLSLYYALILICVRAPNPHTKRRLTWTH